MFSASAAFFIEGQMQFTGCLFAGHDPVADDLVVDAAAGCIRDLAAGTGVALHPDTGLRSIRERPVAVCVPWPPTPQDLDRRLVGNMGACLGAAFFHTADLVAERPGLLGGVSEVGTALPSNTAAPLLPCRGPAMR